MPDPPGLIQGLLSMRPSQLLKNRRLWTIIITTGVIALIGFSLFRDWQTLVTFHWQFKWYWLVIVVILHSLALGTMFLAWHYIMRRMDDLNNWALNFRIFSLSMLARRIPTPFWYVGSRLVFYKAQQVSAAVVLSATLLEITLIGLSGVLCFTLLLPWYSFSQDWPWRILLIIAAIFALALFFRPSLLIDLINRIQRIRQRPLIAVNINRSDLAIWGLLYLATWFLDGIGLYFTVIAFSSVYVGIIDIVGISTLSALVALASLALPSGFGLKEITIGGLLSIWMPISAGVIIAIIYRLLQTIIETFWMFVGQRIAPESLE